MTTDETKNEVQIYDPSEGDILPGGVGDLSLVNYRLAVEARGREQGFVYGGKKDGQRLGFDLEMIFVSVRERRTLFGIGDYNRVRELKANNVVVCRSWNGQDARGIARLLKKDEEECLAGGREWYGWADDDLKDRRCTNTEGKATCPMATGEDWICRPRYELLGLLRSPGDDESGKIEWFVPFLWELSGGSIKPMLAARARIIQMGIRVPWVYKHDGKEYRKRSPRYRFSVQCSLVESHTGAAGLYPEFASPRALLDKEFEDVLTSYFAGADAPMKQLSDASIAFDQRQQARIGTPPPKASGEEEKKAEEEPPAPKPGEDDFDTIPF